MKRILISAILLIVAALTLSAQKYGHLNSSQLILSMPEVKTADAQLESYQKQLFAKGEEMVSTFETEYNAYLQQANSGELSQIQMQTKEGALAEKQNEIRTYELQVQELLATKKQELYQPILDKVQTVVDQIGKEMNYTMIFDTSMGGLLFVEGSEDLMPTMKAKLGI
ncbi:MAG: OmpH family outer membrane protein [Bacteroidota bacterium]